MPLVVSDLGEIEALRLVLTANVSPPRVWFLHLFKNNYSPNRATVLADLTEADYSGYSPVGIDPAQWSTPQSAGGVAYSWWGGIPTEFFSASGSQNVYGYYLTFQVSGTDFLFWSERFQSVQTVTTTAPATVWPNFTGHSEYEPPPP